MSRCAWLFTCLGFLLLVLVIAFEDAARRTWKLKVAQLLQEQLELEASSDAFQDRSTQMLDGQARAKDLKEARGAAMRENKAQAMLSVERGVVLKASRQFQTKRARGRFFHSHMRDRQAGTNSEALRGRFAVLQHDTRFCNAAAAPHRTAHTTLTQLEQQPGDRNISSICGVKVDANASKDAYWWQTAALNSVWARTHGYDYLISCAGHSSNGCTHSDSQEKRSPCWCKIIVLADVLESGKYDGILFMDSDATWKDPKLGIFEGLIRPFAFEWVRTNHLSEQEPVIFFGCNSPWDHGGLRWNFSAPYAASGSANVGVMLLRNKSRAREMLRYWWHARAGWAQPYDRRTRGIFPEQDVLWRMWSVRPDLASSMRVLGKKSPTNGKRYCLRTIGTHVAQKHSPVLHLASNGMYDRWRQHQLEVAWRQRGDAHDHKWCVQRVDINTDAAAARLFGHVDATQESRPWFDTTVTWHEGSGDRFCKAGVRSTGQVRDICCAKSCGTCGGSGCSKRPAGRAACCIPAIRRTGHLCQNTSSVACRIA